ncbi:hypothetical protein [Endozoicomonas sp. 8E]|uniref:hypothetical protein n=1 Tax=Endozoicomonas sp. 8E TaxID=3035692 RepID=UPI002938EBE1|nr:hypothetical protein [Endozoicomonas sp. 8E]WOG26980.1 hypothetical protein P6910_20880 [Endozoicomonas sp. 8E]
MTRRYIVELKQDAVFSNQSFSIKPDQRVLSYNTSDIAHKKGSIRSDLPSDYNRQKFFSYEVKTTLIESISWQLLYATNLLVAFELIMTSKAPPLGATSYSWLPVEGVVTAGWLLKSYWNPDSELLKPIEQSEMRLILGNQPFAITTMMHGSGYGQQQSQLPESSGQQAPPATSHQPTSAFTSPLHSGSGDGYGDPQQNAHTLGLDCFVPPCHGVCKFRSSSENMEPAERSLNSEESLASPAGAAPGQSSCPHNCLCYRCIKHSDPANETSHNPFAIQLQCASGQVFQIHDIDDNPVNTTAPAVPAPCNLKIVDQHGQLHNCEKVYKSVQSLLNHQRKIHTGQKTCLAPVVGKDGRLRPCGKVWKNAGALSSHKKKTHTGQQICAVIMVTEDGQERPCGKVCVNAIALSSHKKSAHSGQRTCDMAVVAEDGQPRPCGKLCKSAQSLSCHKFRQHTGKKTCDVTVVGEDGKLQPCGRVCKSAKTLSSHKLGCHSGKKTCDLTLVGEDGQQRPCGKVCVNVRALKYHKTSAHTGQQTCSVMMVGKNGEQWPCGKVCKNSQALYVHKRIPHTGQQTCDVKMVGEDGQQWLCGKVYKNVKALSVHKRIHRKRKPVDAKQKDGLSPQVNK